MDTNDIIVSVLIMGLMVLASVVKMLLSHQRKMTEIVHQVNAQQRNPQADLDNSRFEQEISELKQLVLQQSIALDDIRNRPMVQPGDPSIQNRLEVS